MPTGSYTTKLCQRDNLHQCLICFWCNGASFPDGTLDGRNISKILPAIRRFCFARVVVIDGLGSIPSPKVWLINNSTVCMHAVVSCIPHPCRAFSCLRLSRDHVPLLCDSSPSSLRQFHTEATSFGLHFIHYIHVHARGRLLAAAFIDLESSAIIQASECSSSV